MPERNHEVIIDGFLFPDTVTVTLANDEYINSRDYVGKELYESICAANDAWQEQNAKLRELVRDMVDYGEGAGNGMAEWFADRMRELGVEVDA